MVGTSQWVQKEAVFWGEQPTTDVVIKSTQLRTHSPSVSRERREGTLPAGRQPSLEAGPEHTSESRKEGESREDLCSKHLTASFSTARFPRKACATFQMSSSPCWDER